MSSAIPKTPFAGWLERSKPILVGLISVASVVTFWELAGAYGDSPLTIILPPPSRFLASVADSGFRLVSAPRPPPSISRFFLLLFEFLLVWVLRSLQPL